jgi:hypothetical protein
MKAYGKKTWLIPDTYLNSVSKNQNISHESVCVLNTSDKDAEIKLTLFFEDREKRTISGLTRFVRSRANLSRVMCLTRY